MNPTEITTAQGRILGYPHWDQEPQVNSWQAPSEDVVDAFFPLPHPQPRGWSITSEPPTAAKMPAANLQEPPTPPSQPASVPPSQDQQTSTEQTTGFYMLTNVQPEQVAPFISHEHPQTIALILSQLDPILAAGILSHLPEPIRADITLRIATIRPLSLPVLKFLEESLEQSLRDILSDNQDVGGPKVVADILNLTGSAIEKNVLEQMDATDPETTESVRNLMFVFADIAKLNDREIQCLLREVEQNDLIIALKGAGQDLKEKILNNMSEKIRTFITEEMEFAGPMRLSEVEEVQLRIVQQVQKLEEQGQIHIVRGDSDDTFV